MTNDEAIYTLKNTAWLGWDKQKETITEAVKMAVEALQRETSGDAISRHDAIDALMEILDRPNHAEFLYTDEICKVLNELPSAQPEKRTEKRTETHACDLIDRKKVRYKLTALVNELEEIFAHIRERNGDDSVCGLCEYDGAYMGQSGDWCNECPGFERDDCFKLKEKYREEWLKIDG